MNQWELEQHNRLQRLGRKLETAKHGEKKILIEEASRFLGCSPDAIYRRLKKMGFNSQRKRRADKHSSRITQEAVVKVSNLILQSKRDSGKQLMPIQTAIDIAKANGFLDCDVSPAHMGRLMKLYGVHPGQLDRPPPHRQKRSLHPNHVWEFDVSLCVLYYMNGKAGLKHMAKEEFYKNKLENFEKVKHERVLRYVVTDHYSGAFYVHYFLAPGENAQTLFEFLMLAFSKRSGNDPFNGVPFNLVWDAGTANQSHMIQHLLNKLDVNTLTHMPGNPRAKGQVECTHNLIERHFEGLLYLKPISNIETLNQHAHEWMVAYNARKIHSRHNHARYELWQTIRQDQLRLAPNEEACKRLLQQSKPGYRPIRGDLSISYAPKGLPARDYSLRKIAKTVDINVGDEVLAYENPYRSPNINVELINIDGEVVTYELEPVIKNTAGFELDAPVIGQEYKAVAQTPADKQRTAMNREAYGVDDDRAVKKARKKKQGAFNGEVDPFAHINNVDVPSYLDRKGHHMSVQAPHIDLDSTVNWTRFGLKIKAVYGLSGDEIQAIKQQFNKDYPEGIPESQIKPYMQEIMNEEKTTQIRPG